MPQLQMPTVLKVDVVGLPEVMALAKAARNLVDGSAVNDDQAVEVVPRHLNALARALEPLMPGTTPLEGDGTPTPTTTRGTRSDAQGGCSCDGTCGGPKGG